MAFNQMQGAGVVQITKRPITDQEQSNALVYYGSLRNGSRGMAVASMFMAVLNLAVISGALPLADLVILIAILGLAVGLAAVAVGAMTIKARKQIDTAFKEGYVIEVMAPAYLNRAGGSKAPMWNIGPVSVLQTPELQTLLAEGAPASVVCVPGVKAALSVNGVALKRGATITMPPNLAQMAQQSVTAPTYEPMPPQMVQQPGYFPEQQQQPFVAQQQQPYAQPMQQQPYPQPQPPYYPPQPQPVYAPQQQPMFQQPQQQSYPPQQQPNYPMQAPPQYAPQQQPQQPAPVYLQGPQYQMQQQQPAGPPQAPYPGQYPPGSK